MSAFRGCCSLCCTYRTVGAILRLLHLRGCSSLCCTDRAISVILRLVHLRQVHPLRLLGALASLVTYWQVKGSKPETEDGTAETKEHAALENQKQTALE